MRSERRPRFDFVTFSRRVAPALCAVLLTACGPKDAKPEPDLAAAQAHPQPASVVAAPTTSEGLRAAVLAGQRVDYRAVRDNFAASDAYNPYDTNMIMELTQAERAMFGGDDAQALALAESVLEDMHADFTAWLIAGVSLTELGNEADAAVALTIFRGLMDAAAEGRDVQDPNNAWEVLTIREEYIFVRVSGYRVESQAMLVNDLGGRVDMLSCVDSDGVRVEFFFDITRMLESMSF